MDSIREQLGRIDFCDGQIERVELVSGEATIVIRNWQEHILRFRFKGVVYFKSFEFGGDISEVQIAEDAEEIKEAIHVEQDGGGIEAYPNLIQVTFICDAPVMIVVFQEFENES